MWSEECAPEMFKLEYDMPEDFFQFVWDGSGQLTLLFVFFQRIISLYYNAMTVCWLIIISEDEYLNYLAYFDYWSLVLSDVALELWIIYVGKRHNSDDTLDYMPPYLKVKWVLFSAALPSTVLACIAYWTQLYPKISHPMCIITNITSPIAIFLYFLLVAFPLRILHFYFFVIFYLVYIMFTGMYHLAGGTGLNNSKFIYHYLDWNHPTTALFTSFVGLIIGLALYFLFCFVSWGKTWYRENHVYY